jgi:hypothetical protein
MISIMSSLSSGGLASTGRQSLKTERFIRGEIAPPELRQIHTLSPGSLFCGMLLTERK